MPTLMSQDRQIIIVHNGIIENATFLREKLQANGDFFTIRNGLESYFTDIGNFYAGKEPFGEEGKALKH